MYKVESNLKNNNESGGSFDVEPPCYHYYHLVLQKSENLKYHPIDYSTGVIIVGNNNYNFHR